MRIRHISCANRVLLAGVALLASTLARPAQAAVVVVVPHAHGDGFVHWERDGTTNGDTNHNHVFPHTVQGSAGANHVHDAFAVWNNRTYNYTVGAATIAGGMVTPDFWHGFIAPGSEPRYRFLDGAGASTTFNATSRGIIASAITEWVTRARAQAATRTTPNGTALVTGIGLTNTTGATYEIRIGFFDELIEQTGANARWVVAREQIWAGSGLAAADLTTSPILAFDDDLNWLFDTTMAPAGTQVDFFTIALHELGHVFGLLHAPGDPAGNIMRASIINEAQAGNTRRTVETSSANGAAELYSQPVPEPGSLLLLTTVGILGTAVCRWRRRNSVTC